MVRDGREGVRRVGCNRPYNWSIPCADPGHCKQQQRTVSDFQVDSKGCRRTFSFLGITSAIVVAVTELRPPKLSSTQCTAKISDPAGSLEEGRQLGQRGQGSRGGFNEYFWRECAARRCRHLQGVQKRDSTTDTEDNPATIRQCSCCCCRDWEQPPPGCGACTCSWSFDHPSPSAFGCHS